MNEIYGNLHFHSTHSDGVDSPERLVEIAKEEGYKALALTDHDTATGIDELRDACKKHGLDYLVGAELTGVGFDQNFHIVGLDFDMNNQRIKEYFDYMAKKCVYRTKGLFDRGIAQGTLKNISWDEVVDFNKGITNLCVDHVFAAMKNKGVITDNEYPDFHKQNFSYSIPFENIYDYKKIEEVISTIREAGGIAILAHGAYANNQFSLLPELIAMGLNGIEAWHADHTDEQALQAEELAKEHNLYISGGTDHSGLMGGQYRFYEDETTCPYFIPSMKYGVTKENYFRIKDRVLG